MKPVVTIKQNEDGWSYCLWNSDCTGKMDLSRSERDIAEEKAKKFAMENELIYLPPEGHFMTIAKTVSLEGDRFHVLKQGHDGPEELVVVHKNVEEAFRQAFEIASEEGIDCEPYWYLNEFSKRIQPIVTVKPIEDKWVIATWKSDQTGDLFNEDLFDDREGAEEAAKAFATDRGHVFVQYDTPFLSIAKIKNVYASVMITFSDGVKPIRFLPDFLTAVEFSQGAAAHDGIPFEPHWYINEFSKKIQPNVTTKPKWE